MRKIAVTLFVVFPLLCQAQFDVPLSQYLSNQATFNPAYSGVHGVTSMNLNSRLQWAGFEGAPLTNILNVHSSFLDDKLGGGITFLNDRYGVNSNNEIHLSYSYKIEVNDILFSMGLQTGLVSYSYDYSKLNTEITDPNFTEAGETFTKPNFGAGIFAMTDTWYFGLSIPKFQNLVVENGGISSTRYKRHFYLSGGYVFDQIFAFKLKPSFLLRTVDGGFTAMDINLSALINDKFWVGLSSRNLTDALGVHTLWEVNKNFRAGISAEISNQTFSGANFGTYEVMVSYDLGSVGNRYF